MKIQSATDIGEKRQKNEDFFCVLESENIFIVCDGMGGHKAGEIASKTATNKIIEDIMERKNTSDFDFIRDIEEILQNANRHIYNLGVKKKNYKNMGTTVIICFIDHEDIFFVNVGDSRAYIIENNQLSQISKDHSLVAELVKIGSISEDQAKTHPDKNIITSALGMEKPVDIYTVKRKIASMTHILLCTDGLTNLVSELEIESVFLNNPIESVPDKLIQLANGNGGDDNITVICIEL